MMEQLKQLTASFWMVARQRKLLLETETAWFVLASTLDFLMTYIMLSHYDDQFIESNPIAVFFLNHWGLKGLLGFKLAVVSLVVLICQVIAHHNVKVARRVLYLGTTVVAAVVVYSVLLHQSAPLTGESWEEFGAAHQYQKTSVNSRV